MQRLASWKPVWAGSRLSEQLVARMSSGGVVLLELELPEVDGVGVQFGLGLRRSFGLFLWLGV